MSTDHKGAIYALRNPQFVSFQFHLESILTTNGYNILETALNYLLIVYETLMICTYAAAVAVRVDVF